MIVSFFPQNCANCTARGNGPAGPSPQVQALLGKAASIQSHDQTPTLSLSHAPISIHMSSSQGLYPAPSALPALSPDRRIWGRTDDHSENPRDSSWSEKEDEEGEGVRAGMMDPAIRGTKNGAPHGCDRFGNNEYLDESGDEHRRGIPNRDSGRQIQGIRNFDRRNRGDGRIAHARREAENRNLLMGKGAGETEEDAKEKGKLQAMGGILAFFLVSILLREWEVSLCGIMYVASLKY